MYVPSDYTLTAGTWDWSQRLREHVMEILEILQQGFSGSLPVAIGFVFEWIHTVFTQSSEWILQVFYSTVKLVHAHIYWAHIIAWSIFFGPIVVLVPFILIHEVFIIIAHNLTYTLHGLLPYPLPDQYEALRLLFLDTRESLFSFVDRTSNVFNKWTAEHLPLMVLRLAGGALGTILLYAIWIGW